MGKKTLLYHLLQIRFPHLKIKKKISVPTLLCLKNLVCWQKFAKVSLELELGEINSVPT